MVVQIKIEVHTSLFQQIRNKIQTLRRQHVWTFDSSGKGTVSLYSFFFFNFYFFSFLLSARTNRNLFKAGCGWRLGFRLNNIKHTHTRTKFTHLYNYQNTNNLKRVIEWTTKQNKKEFKLRSDYECYFKETKARYFKELIINSYRIHTIEVHLYLLNCHIYILYSG